MTKDVDDNEPLCQCCQKVPPAGYVCRHGIYLEKICFNCYKNHPEDKITSQRNRSTVGGKFGARS